MLFKLLGLPLTLPIKGIRFCLEQVADLAEAELMDEDVVREQLLLLQLRLEEGEVDEEEYVEEEQALLDRLREIRALRRQRLSEQMSSAEEGEVLEGGTRRLIVEGPLLEMDER